MASKVLAAAVRRSLSPRIPTSIRSLSTAAAAVAEPFDETAGISMKGVKISGRPLYLDMQATSPVDPRVLDAMLPYFVSRYGNPHSRTHLYGWESDEAVEVARAQVANLINASPKEIVFTSGATECNNISVKGVMHFYKEKKKHGVGALYMRRRPRIRVEPQMNGGGQERGIRSGTVPTPLVVGMGAACELAMKEMEYDEKRVTKLKDRMLNGIRDRLDGVVVNGSTESRYAGNLNLSFAYVEGESLLMGLKEVAVSSGSACTSASLEPSYVLRALGVDEDMAHTSIRFGIGRFTTEEEIDKAIELTVNQVEKLREMSPLYEMVKEGIDIKSIQWSQH
ncbi:Aminotransferase, class V/Cysteine desulfurase [Cynara cardunculus var. scolymus]|uniref:Aminotransferase, class V/Cysteine desulfurase n=1 Tax=Cynara cardunculus var. scolymus TaxID=59895 RepID=A0A103YGY7_CYNCS|nr:Aminotransferase, class V/Cysteine desulfurase [Cynara cardunculus var. scolymus]